MIRTRRTFGKSERLCSVKLISEIFETGNVIYTPNLKLIWKLSSRKLPSPAQVVISVPKKCIKKAVERNTIKRRLREAYRKNKIDLYGVLRTKEIQIVFIMIYRPCVLLSHHEIDNSVTELLKILSNTVKSALNNN
jgi:ribonuclease P protein component